MKTSMKIICIMLTICLAGAIVPSVAFANDKNQSEAAKTLIALDIMQGYEDGDFKLDKVITRAEFTVMVARTLGISEEGEGTTTFKDIPEGHWAGAAIEVCRSMGLVSGYNEDTFGPDDPVLYEQAIKILTNALGYEQRAEASGGYPIGYITVASREGLLKRTNAISGQILRRGVVVQLIFNALTIDIVQQTGYGETATSIITPGVNLLSRRHNIAHGTGIISASGHSSLTGLSGIGKNEIEINGEVFHVGMSDAQRFLGYDVTYYAEDTSGKNTLVYVSPREGTNNAVTVLSDSILDEQGSFSVTRFIYEDERKVEKSLTISPYADLIYNGVAQEGFAKEDLAPSDGFVTLLDNNGDNVFEVIYVTEYETIVVGGVGGKNSIVSDKYDSTKRIELEPQERESVLSITKADNAIGIDEIRKNDILSIAKSKNTVGTVVIEVIVSDETITGILEEKIDEMTEEDIRNNITRNTRLVIDGEEYKVDLSMLTRVRELYFGMSATFYMTASGKVASFDAAAQGDTQFQYAYLINAAKEKGISDRCEFKILTQVGDVVVKRGAQRISIDGELPLSNADAILESLAVNGEISQLLKFSMNKEGEISRFDTVLRGDNEGDNSLTLGLPSIERRYMQVGGSFGVKDIDLLVDSDTIVFIIPPEEDKNDDSKYAVTGMAHFVQGEYYTFETYDMTSGMYTSVALIKDSTIGTKIDNNTPVSVITSISQAMTEDGERVQKISVMQNGNQMSYYGKDANSLEGYQIGEFVRLGTDSRGRVEKVEECLNPLTDPLGTKGFAVNSTRFFANIHLAYGYVVTKEDASIVITTNPDNPSARIPYKLLPTHRVTIFNVKAQSFEKGTVNDIDAFIHTINENRRIVVNSGTGRITEIFLIDFGN